MDVTRDPARSATPGVAGLEHRAPLIPRWQLRAEFNVPDDGIDYGPRLEALVDAMRTALGADFIDHASVHLTCERIDDASKET